MKFFVAIDCENEAFGENRHSCNREVASILRHIAASLTGMQGGKVKDLNGNTVGSWEYTEDQPAASSDSSSPSEGITLGELWDALLPSAKSSS